MRGDLRVAYLAWLLAVQSGGVREKTLEPAVPPGLSELTAPQDAMVEFLRIDEDLVSVAAEGSSPISDDRAALMTWTLALSPRAKDEWLRRAVDDPGLALGGELLRAFRASTRLRSASKRRGRSSRCSSPRVRTKTRSSSRSICAISGSATALRARLTHASRRCGSASSEVVDSSIGGSARASRDGGERSHERIVSVEARRRVGRR